MSCRFRHGSTYDIDSTDTKRKADFQQKGKTWSQQNDWLKGFFDQKAADGLAFTFRAGAPFTIDLGDESIAW